MDFFLAATVLVCYLIFKAFRKSQVKVNLKSKNILITGASSGLGKSLAENLCKHHNVNLFLCARSVGKLEELKKDLKAINPNNVVEVYYLDLCKTETIGDFVGSLVQNHKIDTIINNAGVRFRGDILSTSYEVYKKVFETNFFGQVALTNGFVKYFVKSGIKGHIVNIGSVQAKLSTPYRAPYSASKHACQAFYDAVRAETTKHGIKVTTVHPGYIKTDSSKNAILSDGSVSGKSEVEKGMTSDEVACRIIDAIAENKNEILVAPVQNYIAVYIRAFLPNMYFFLIKKRAK